MNNELLWNKFLENIKNNVNSMVYLTWFSKTYLFSLDNNVATIVVPLEIHRNRLCTIYNELITNVLTQITGKIYELNFILEQEVESKKEEIITQNNNSKPIEKNTFKHESNLNPKYTFDTFMALKR